MQEVEVRSKTRRGNCASHQESGFEQRPVEALAVESEQHGALGEPRGEFVQDGMLVRVIAHEELLDLQPA